MAKDKTFKTIELKIDGQPCRLCATNTGGYTLFEETSHTFYPAYPNDENNDYFVQIKNKGYFIDTLKGKSRLMTINGLAV